MEFGAVQQHYDDHLASFYSWMCGDFDQKTTEFESFLRDNGISPSGNKIALDLGAGHGIQTLPLAQLGFRVTAVDFCEDLLTELKENTKPFPVSVVCADIRNTSYFNDEAELVVCCGDTLSHLESKVEIEGFLNNVSTMLGSHGKLILSFRDYSIPLEGESRFVPVKSDDNRILTCILDYAEDFVQVTDLLHEKTEHGWILKVSTYQKVRVRTSEIVSYLQEIGFNITFNDQVNRLNTIIASK